MGKLKMHTMDLKTILKKQLFLISDKGYLRELQKLLSHKEVKREMERENLGQIENKEQDDIIKPTRVNRSDVNPD